MECLGGLGTPCSGRGTCNIEGKCDCRKGYIGPICEVDCPGGVSNECSGHGRCELSTLNTSRCVCESRLSGFIREYRGEMCEVAVYNIETRISSLNCPPQANASNSSTGLDSQPVAGLAGTALALAIVVLTCAASAPMVLYRYRQVILMSRVLDDGQSNVLLRLWPARVVSSLDPTCPHKLVPADQVSIQTDQTTASITSITTTITIITRARAPCHTRTWGVTTTIITPVRTCTTSTLYLAKMRKLRVHLRKQVEAQSEIIFTCHHAPPTLVEQPSLATHEYTFVCFKTRNVLLFGIGAQNLAAYMRAWLAHYCTFNAGNQKNPLLTR